MKLYLDTSVLVSCYVSEMQTEFVFKKLENMHQTLLVSQLAEVEFVSALSMKHRMQGISTQQKNIALNFFQQHLDMGYYTKAYLTDETYLLAKQMLQITTLKLRILDALHLALSKMLSATLFTADMLLAEAAKKLSVAYDMPIA